MGWRRALRPEVWIPLLAIALRLVPGPRIIDDAYIIFRYAQNVLAGQGLVFNPGEPVFGITTPLFAGILVALGAVTGRPNAPFPALAVGVSALADAATCVLLIRLAGDVSRRPAGILAAVVWAVAPMSVTFAVGGMETSVFVLLTTATLYFHSIGAPVAAALAAGLSLVTRPDAVLVVGLVALERARQARQARRGDPRYPRVGLQEVVALAAAPAAWGAFAWPAYGSPLPHSILAKAAAYHLPPEAGLVRLLQHFATPFHEHDVFGTPWIAVGLVLYAILYALGALDSIRHRVERWPQFAYMPLYFATFSAANPLIFRWYLAPPLPMYFLGIFLGVARLARDLRRPGLVWALGGLAVALSLNAWTLAPDTGPRRPAPEMAFVGLEDLYADLGRRLKGRVGPTETIAAGDVGALGYTSGARILDLVGLVSPQVVAYYPLPDEAYVINYAVPAQAIRDEQPEYVVLLEVYGRRTVLRDPFFLHSYRRIESLPTDIYGSQGLLVFQRMEAR